MNAAPEYSGSRQTPLTQWESALRQAVQGTCVDRVLVLGGVDSTQDEARSRISAHERGLMIVASVQEQGRGQRGNVWHDGEAHTLPCSIAVRTKLDAIQIAARAGLAALDTIAQAAPDHDVRIKWPNDIVLSVEGAERKLAGVLVERSGDLAVIGTGINVAQRSADFRKAVRARGISLAMLGVQADRLGLARSLLLNTDRWLSRSDDEIRDRWRERDAVVGTERAYLAGNERFEGVVRAIDPLRSITLETERGVVDLNVALARSASAVRADA